MFRTLFRVAAATALAACASSVLADETTVVNLPSVEPIQLTYRAFDPQHVLVGEDRLLSALSDVSNTATRFHLRAGEPDTQSSVYDTGSQTKIERTRRLLVIQYLAHTRFLSGGFTGTTLSIPVAYSIDRLDDRVVITLTFPATAKSERHGMPILTRKLWDMTSITDDYANIATQLHSADLKLNYQASGELESKYKQEAVLGNLERMLGRPNNRSTPLSQISADGSVMRDGTFTYTVAGKRREVHVSTLPYHDGCKVAYVATLPFTLTPDGGATGDETGQALRDLLTKVVND